MGPEFGPVFGASEYWQAFPEGSENGRIFRPAFWCWRTTGRSFLESHNLDAERPFLQQHAAGELQSVAS